MAWNRPDLRERVVWVNEQWRAVLTVAFSKAAAEYGSARGQLPPIVALVMTFNQGLFSERLLGIDTGHDELLALDRGLASDTQGGRHRWWLTPGRRAPPGASGRGDVVHPSNTGGTSARP